MTDTDMSLLQRWLGERFAEVGQRLLALEAAVNEFAKAPGAETVEARLTDLERRMHIPPELMAELEEGAREAAAWRAERAAKEAAVKEKLGR